MRLEQMPTKIYLALEGIWEQEDLHLASPGGLAMLYAKALGYDLAQALEMIDVHKTLTEIERSQV